jgi:hypothetical protein
MSTYKYYDKYGIENFKIILIKSYKVVRTSQRDNAHLRVYEQLWLNKTKKAVNKHKAFNPLAKLDKYIYNENNKEKINEKNKEYRENNKEKINEKNKEYRENNKEKLNEYNKEYRENNNEYHKEYRENNKEKLKEYRENNKEKRNEKSKEYYLNNKEKINKKITCECGSIITKNNLSTHIKSKKHLKLMEKNN